MFSPEQIDQKRRQALEKLKSRNNNQTKLLGSPCSTKTSFQSNLKKINNSSISTLQNINRTPNVSSISVANMYALKETNKLNNGVFKREGATNQNSSPGPAFSSTVNARYAAQPYVVGRPLVNRFDKKVQTTSQNVFFGKTETVTCKTYLVSEDKFAVEMGKFSQQLVEIFKTIPSRSYDAVTRTWSFHINDYEQLIEKANSLRPIVTIGCLPSYVLRCVRSTKTDYSQIDLSRIEPNLRDALMPFQRDGVCFGIDKKGRCLIADDMGLGKTFQALGIASYYKDDWPLLIVTTSSTRDTWLEKIQHYLSSVLLAHAQVMQTSRDYIGDARILIASYDLMSRCCQQLLDAHFGVVIMNPPAGIHKTDWYELGSLGALIPKEHWNAICDSNHIPMSPLGGVANEAGISADESHTLKNFKAKCTKAAQALAQQARRVILLSGTPALSRPSELYTQISMIDEQFFVSFKEYSSRYCNGHNNKFGWDASGQSNLPELEILLNKQFMIRRTKEQVLSSLPGKTREVVKLDSGLRGLSEVQRKSLNELNDSVLTRKGAEKHAALLTYFSETAKLKIKPVCEYLAGILKEDVKFLIFAHHQVMMNAICDLLEANKVHYVRIDGKTPSEQRKMFVDKYQLQDKYKCAVLSITAASEGITLTAGQLVLFAELHWNPSILSQAESRAHRIGQERSVQVRYLISAGTADDFIWENLNNKQKVLINAGLTTDHFENVTVSEHRSSLPRQRSITEFIDNSNSLPATSVEEDDCIAKFYEDDGDDDFAGLDIDF